jgi:hypothetical protein
MFVQNLFHVPFISTGEKVLYLLSYLLFTIFYTIIFSCDFNILICCFFNIFAFIFIDCNLNFYVHFILPIIELNSKFINCILTPIFCTIKSSNLAYYYIELHLIYLIYLFYLIYFIFFLIHLIYLIYLISILFQNHRQ